MSVVIAPGGHVCSQTAVLQEEEEDNDAVSCSTALTQKASNTMATEAAQNFVREYLAHASVVLGENFNTFLSTSAFFTTQEAEQPRTMATTLIRQSLPPNNSFLVNNLPEFLRQAQELHTAGVRRSDGDMFYTFWFDENRRDGNIVGSSVAVQPARGGESSSGSGSSSIEQRQGSRGNRERGIGESRRQSVSSLSSAAAGSTASTFSTDMVAVNQQLGDLPLADAVDAADVDAAAVAEVVASAADAATGASAGTGADTGDSEAADHGHDSNDDEEEEWDDI